MHTFEEEWEQLSLELLVKLVDSVPRRLVTITNARGGNTRYSCEWLLCLCDGNGKHGWFAAQWLVVIKTE